MALDVTSLANTIYSIDVESQGGDLAPEAAARIRARANKLAQAIMVFVKSGTVTTTSTVAAGIPVVTSGSPTSQTGATISTGQASGTGTIS